jgi:transcriptional regulator of NAD metabolism
MSRNPIARPRKKALQHGNATPVAKPRPGKSGLLDLRGPSGAERRSRMLACMNAGDGPVLGTELAKRFRVSRQCVVQDIAILRAAGEDILATPQGYRAPEAREPMRHRAVLACRHAPEQTEEELHILVDHGVRVLDVIVDHELYGELTGTLMLESRADVQEFLHRWRSTGAILLSSLTRQIHLHTVEANRPEMIAQARSQLHARGFLVK